MFYIIELDRSNHTINMNDYISPYIRIFNENNCLMPYVQEVDLNKFKTKTLIGWLINNGKTFVSTSSFYKLVEFNIDETNIVSSHKFVDLENDLIQKNVKYFVEKKDNIERVMIEQDAFKIELEIDTQECCKSMIRDYFYIFQSKKISFKK